MDCCPRSRSSEACHCCARAPHSCVLVVDPHPPQHPVRLRLHCRHRRSILVPLALATLTSPMAPTFATLRVPPLGSVPSLVAALSCRLVTWVTSVPLVVTLAWRPRFCLGVLLLVVACKIGTGGSTLTIVIPRVQDTPCPMDRSPLGSTVTGSNQPYRKATPPPHLADIHAPFHFSGNPPPC